MPRRISLHTPHAQGRPVTLAKSTDASSWNVLAYAVELKGRGVTLTRETFAQCVANFEAEGSERPVVLFHADTQGGHPDAAKAHGWITDLRVGSMDRKGSKVATLEGKIRWVNEATKADVESEALKFGSVTILPEAIDEETGDELGAYLYSFSLTNNPALTDLPAIAASRLAGHAQALGYYYGDLDSREDVLGMLRAVFELPVTTDEAATLAALDRLGALAAKPEEEREGIDTDALIRSLRASLRLPALSSLDEVLAEVRKALASLPSEMAEEPSPESLSRGRAASTPGVPMKNALTLARDLGIAAASDDEAAEKIVALARDHVEVRKALALGPAPTGADVAARIAELSTEAAKVPGLTAELTALKATEAARAKAERDEHVAAVVSANGGALKPAEAALAAFAESNFAEFAKRYPRPASDARTVALTRSVFAETGATPPAVTGQALSKPFAEAAHELATEMVAKDPSLTYKAALSRAGAAIKAAQTSATRTVS